MKKLFMAALLPGLLIGCSPDTGSNQLNDNLTSRWFSLQEAQTITVTTLDNKAIAGAEILIGDSLDTPFSGNFLTTNAQGQAELPQAWSEPLAVTVQAPGYMRTTYMAQTPGNLSFTLRPLATSAQYEIKGRVQDLPVVNKDGFVDFGLVIPAFTKKNLLAFDMNQVISPQNDIISAIGQEIPVPTNISLPKQSERYSLFTVTLDKPQYRVYFDQPGITRVYAARGRFPFKPVVDSLRDGKEFYELINEFKISGGGIRDIEINSRQMTLDIPSKELNFTDKKEIVAPRFERDETFIAVGIAQQSGYLIPTDVKQIAATKKMTLSTQSGFDQQVLAVLKKTADLKDSKGNKDGSDRMSVTLLPLTAGVAPTMLPLIENPRLSNPGEILMPRFESIPGVQKIGTYSVLSAELEIQQGNAKVKVMNPQWEVYAQSWVDRMQLPQWPNDQEPRGKKRWEVNFIGSQTASQAAPGAAMIEAATHVTHSSISF